MYFFSYDELKLWSFFSDLNNFAQVVALLLTSSMSAALAIAQVGKKGNTHAGWLPICGQVHKFCNHVTGALVAGIIAAALYFLLILYTLYTVLNPLFVVKP